MVLRRSLRCWPVVGPCLTALVALLVLAPLVPAWGQSMEGGARAAALGGATTALAGEVWGHANPAGWATRSGRAVSFFASEAFGLAELRLAAFQYVEPTRLGAVALGARTFGFDAYRETHATLGWARGFRLGTTRRFHAGLTLRWHQVAISSYGSAGALGVSAGWLVEAMPRLHLGMQATNLNGPKLAGREELPRSLSVGLGYQAAERLRLLLDAHKEVRYPLSVRAGLEVQPVEALALRTGVTTEPVRFTAGVGVRLGRLAADLAAERHDVLGWSPGVSLSVLW